MSFIITCLQAEGVVVMIVDGYTYIYAISVHHHKLTTRYNRNIVGNGIIITSPRCDSGKSRVYTYLPWM